MRRIDRRVRLVGIATSKLEITFQFSTLISLTVLGCRLQIVRQQAQDIARHTTVVHSVKMSQNDEIDALYR